MRYVTNSEFRALPEGTLVRVIGGRCNRPLAIHHVQLGQNEQGETIRIEPCVEPNYWEFLDFAGIARVGFIPVDGADGDPVIDRAHGVETYMLVHFDQGV